MVMYSSSCIVDGGIQHFSAMGRPAPKPVQDKKKQIEEEQESSSEEEVSVPQQRKTRSRSTTAKRRTRAAAEKAVETIQDLAPGPRRKKQRST